MQRTPPIVIRCIKISIVFCNDVVQECCLSKLSGDMHCPVAVKICSFNPCSILQQHVSNRNAASNCSPMQRILPRIISGIHISTVLNYILHNMREVVESSPLNSIVAISVRFRKRSTVFFNKLAELFKVTVS
uniref:Uncharacterized protein n=1 Tax=Opuntia streptacantha TaxID=393608 RepID=A0A7C9DTW8_OPUST